MTSSAYNAKDFRNTKTTLSNVNDSIIVESVRESDKMTEAGAIQLNNSI